MSTFIENGDVFVDGKLVNSNLVVCDGKIHELTDDRVTCENYIDASGMFILPGCIDSFAIGAREFSGEGVTTALFLPGERMHTQNVNFGFHLGVSLDNFDELKLVRNMPSFFIEHVSEEFRKVFSVSRRVSVAASDAALAISMVKDMKARLCVFDVTGQEEKLFRKKPRISYAAPVKNFDDKIWNMVQNGLIDICYGPNSLAFLLGAASINKISVARCVELCMENPARAFGLLNKGFIKPGFDADLAIVDEKLHQPVITMVNGMVVFGKDNLQSGIGKEAYFW